jgi:hypothetical protein
MLGDPTTGEYWSRLYGVDAAKMDAYLSLFLYDYAPEVWSDPVECRFRVQQLLEDRSFDDPQLKPARELP